MSEQHDLEAQERAAIRIGDRQAAAKARARLEQMAANHDAMVGRTGGDPTEPLRD